MSFNKKHVRSLETLKEEYAQDPDGFINRYRKADALLGDSEAVEFVRDKLDAYIRKSK